MKINFIARPEIVAFDSFRKRLHPVWRKIIMDDRLWYNYTDRGRIIEAGGGGRERTRNRITAWERTVIPSLEQLNFFFVTRVSLSFSPPLFLSLSGRFPKYGGRKAVRLERTVFGYKNAENVDDGSQGKRSDSPRCFKFAEQRFRPSTGIWLPFFAPFSLSLSLFIEQPLSVVFPWEEEEEESDNSGIMEVWWNLFAQVEQR